VKRACARYSVLDVPDAADVAIPSDLHCYNCGYNLRGLDPTGACPECGRPAGDSLDQRAVRARLLRVAGRGSVLLGSAMALGVAAAAVTVTVNGWAVLLLPVAGLLGAVGTWQFTVRLKVRGWKTTVLRGACILTLLMQMQFAGFLLWHWATADPMEDGALRLSMYSMLLPWAAAAAATCWHASTIADDVRDTSGFIQARLLGALAPATVIGAAAPVEALLAGNALLTPLVAWGACAFAVAGWCAVYFLGFAVVLSRAIRATATQGE
jgi:hypothetical protein